MSASRIQGISESPKQNCSDEKISGLLVNVFGLRLPREESSITEEKFNGMLINVFGLKLPTEMVQGAYSIILQEYASPSENASNHK